jgi:hypothetical protein
VRECEIERIEEKELKLSFSAWEKQEKIDKYLQIFTEISTKYFAAFGINRPIKVQSLQMFQTFLCHAKIAGNQKTVQTCCVCRSVVCKTCIFNHSVIQILIFNLLEEVKITQGESRKF